MILIIEEYIFKKPGCFHVIRSDNQKGISVISMKNSEDMVPSTIRWIQHFLN
jgi:hypothetical protein